MTKNTFKIVITGGGTAGWLTAAFLSAQLPSALNRGIDITLVEASDVPTIGVGEATIPSLRETLAACNIDESEFMQACGATFKHGIEFINWKTGRKDQGDRYFHPFGSPILVAGKNIARQWRELDPATRGEFADLFSVQPEIAKAGRAPKHIRDQPYDGALAYAYHLDAGRLAEFLKSRMRASGVSHIIGKVTQVIRDQHDNISALHLENEQTLVADLFIDCTGFAARLINSDKTNPFIDKSDQLFVDRAVTTKRDHAGIDDVTGYTKCTAQTAGWIWDIALQKRRGVGHVYSSKYIDDDTAKRQLADYVGVAEHDLESRKLAMRIGYHKYQWRGNCVAIGLSSGFLEPLESTGIYLTEMANWALLELLPRYLGGAKPQARHDEIMTHHYENITDFLKLHYCLSQREEGAFWRDNRKAETISDTLKNYLMNWKNAVPSIYDFDRTTQCFSATNYQFVLYGMGWTGHDHPVKRQTYHDKALSELALRRARLLLFVTRDTAPHDAFLKA